MSTHSAISPCTLLTGCTQERNSQARAAASDKWSAPGAIQFPRRNDRRQVSVSPYLYPASRLMRVRACRYVPPGTQVYVPPYILHRDPRFFSPAPDTFLPSRWLSTGDGAPAGNVLDRTAFIPFSYGPANCVGRQLARMEMRMVVCLLVQTFDFAFADGFDKDGWLGTVHDHLVSTRGPLMLRLTERVGA